MNMWSNLTSSFSKISCNAKSAFVSKETRNIRAIKDQFAPNLCAGANRSSRDRTIAINNSLRRSHFLSLHEQLSSRTRLLRSTNFVHFHSPSVRASSTFLDSKRLLCRFGIAKVLALTPFYILNVSFELLLFCNDFNEKHNDDDHLSYLNFITSPYTRTTSFICITRQND